MDTHEYFQSLNNRFTLMFIVSGLYCSQRFQNIIPYYTHVYRKLMAVCKTGMGLKGTGTLGCMCGHSGTWGHRVWDMWHKGQGPRDVKYRDAGDVGM